MAILPEGLVGQPISLDSRILKKLALTLSILIGILFGLIASANWQDILKLISSTPFGITDPIFSKDISFYIFSVPVYQTIIGLVKFILLLTFIGSAFFYFLRGIIRV